MEITRACRVTWRKRSCPLRSKHLWPKQLLRHGLSDEQLKVNDAGLKYVIDSYCREAGVRYAGEADCPASCVNPLCACWMTEAEKLRGGQEGRRRAAGQAPVPVRTNPCAVLVWPPAWPGPPWAAPPLPIESSQIHTLNRGFKLTGRSGRGDAVNRRKSPTVTSSPTSRITAATGTSSI